MSVQNYVATDVLRRWADDFGGNALDTSKWDVETNTGGMTYSVSNSNLTVNMGTTVNAELRLLSRTIFSIPFDISAIVQMSQRIANNSFYIEAVEVDADGAPIANTLLATDWNNRASVLMDGTSATTAKLESMGEGANVVLSQSGTITTTATPAGLGMELRALDIQLTSWTPDSAAAKNSTVLLNSSEVPDPNRLYKLRLRFVNGASAPASATTVTVKRVYVQDATEMSVEVASGRGDQNGARAVAVNVTNTPTVLASLTNNTTLAADVGIQLVSGRGTSLTIARLVSAAATTNATLVKASAGKLKKIKGYNAATAVRYLKLYNKTSAPTVGTDTPAVTIALKPSDAFEIDFDAIGLAFTTGISYAITTGSADSDTGVLTAADIVGLNIFYV